ncbi:MAG: cell wall hydrolase [Brevundimonas sp.]|jgi:spore germination cell wall hydrolase CwlJ-like protein
MTIDRETPSAPPPFAGPRRPRPSQRPRRRIRRIHVIGLALLALALAVAAVLVFRSQGAARGAPAVVRPTGLAQQTPAGMQQMLDTTLAPDEIRPITPDEARAFNAALPFSTLPILSAKPFIMPADKLEDYARALDCLTAAVYYEAASETAAGQAAVAQVVVNRMRHPAYPKTICGVVFQGSERTTGCQFSFTCDGAMTRPPSPEGWARARLTAGGALNGFVASGVGMATHYHTDWVAPYWAERLVKMRQIGTHIFYRWGGGWGLPPAFTGRHAGVEPTIEKMALVATPIAPLDLEDPSLTLPPPVLVTMAPPPLAPPPSAPVQAPVTSRPAQAPVSSAASPPPAATARPVVENPLTTSSGEPQPRRRSRIAAPS